MAVYKKFIFRFSLFIAIIFIIDFAFSLVLSHYAIQWQYDKRIERILTHQEKAKVIIMGSSRSFNSVMGEIIHKETKTSTYNYGYPGANIDFQETFLRLMLNNEVKPKLIILTLDEYQEFFADPFVEFRSDYIYPWAKYPDIRDIINEREKYQSLSKSYIYKKCNFGKLYQTKGAPYYPLINDFGPLPRNDRSLTYDTLKYSAFKAYKVENENKYLRDKFLSFIDICRSNDINLLLVNPPNYYLTDNIFNNRIKELIKTKKKVWFYSNPDKKYQDKKWFFDRFHLNTSGAEMYTKELVEYINKNQLLYQ